MSKHKNVETVAEIAPEVKAENAVTEIAPAVEVAATPPSPQAEEPKASEPAAPGPRVFEVEYPGCLIGKQTIVAADGDDACRKYRQSCGMTSNSRPPVVTELPSDSAAYAAAVEAEAARK